MSKIYFRDFLARMIDLGADITRITFVSSSLVSKYEIVSLYGGDLRCIRVRPSGQRENAIFAWGPYIQSHGIHAKFVVKSIARKRGCSEMFSREKLIITLGNPEQR